MFDPQRQAVLLVAGDNKIGRWRRRYEQSIPLAKQRFQRWLDGGYYPERTR